jgi:hypothetical protein
LRDFYQELLQRGDSYSHQAYLCRAIYIHGRGFVAPHTNASMPVIDEWAVCSFDS